MSNKLLIISGPTATGKTALAIILAQKFNGEIISADSRQIYQGMDIGTGKDHPQDVKINLIDIINPDQSFSSSEYRQLAIAKIKEIQSQNKLPIIVGGSGHYIDAILNPQPTYSIKPNNFLRFFLDKLPVFILQKIYKLLDITNYLKLNNSDLYNPRRLIRRIEISLSKKAYPPLVKGGSRGDWNFLHLSLTAPNVFLFPRIDTRIQQRLDLGLLNEIKNLLSKYKWSDPGLNCLAYKEFKPFFKSKNLLISCIKRWTDHEHQYARRQKTWFKKISPISFIDISDPKYSKKAIDLVEKWYNNL